MKDWLKGLVFLVLGNTLYSVVPVWTIEYLLTLPNPYYSIGNFLQNIGTSYQSLSNINTDLFNALNSVKQYVGIALICYALYLVIKTFYKK